MTAVLWFFWHSIVVIFAAFCVLMIVGIIAWPIILIYRLMRWSMGKPNKPLNIGRPPSLWMNGAIPRNRDVRHHHHHHEADNTDAIAIVAATTAAAIIAAEIVEDDED